MVVKTIVNENKKSHRDGVILRKILSRIIKRYDLSTLYKIAPKLNTLSGLEVYIPQERRQGAERRGEIN